MSGPDLTGRDWELIRGALSAQLRYHNRMLDKAKTDDAVNNHANNSVELRGVMDKITEGSRRCPGSSS